MFDKLFSKIVTSMR